MKTRRPSWNEYFMDLAKLENKIYYGNTRVATYDNKALVFGWNLTYFFTSNIASSIFVLLPNTNIDLELSSAAGLNYYF